MKEPAKMEPILTAFNPEPEVRLLNAFEAPYDNAVAAARTCYSSKVIYPADVIKDEKTRARRDAIAKSTYQAGHHTTIQHATFQFIIEKVSRHCIWSFLHSHPFYNSEQVSQRYVAVSPANFSAPSMPEGAREIYLEATDFLMKAYDRLQILLNPAVEQEFLAIFPARDLNDKRWQSALKKRAQEVARYVLPLATHAHLYHTVSGITLLRYLRLCRLFDAPEEQTILVQKMAEEVRRHDPEFFKNAEDPMPIEETPEYAFFAESKNYQRGGAQGFAREFDLSLGRYSSVLVDYKANSEKVMADSVRNVLGLKRSELNDEAAIEAVMNPAQNPYLSDTLNLTHHAKLTRAMVHPHFTFRKKISHTADSQDQRHRTVPASRPILARHFSAEPDYVLPVLVEKSPAAREFYSKTMAGLWARMGRLLNEKADLDAALYLLPNAFPIRFEESGALLDFHHKWVHRLCYTAQEEIWRNAKEEVMQVEALFPLLGRHLRAPCYIRKEAERKPFCPEGERFCGVAVWKQDIGSYKRVL